jgi:hypothetical protein
MNATRTEENAMNTPTTCQIIWSQIPVMTKMACGARQAVADEENATLTFKVTNKPYRFVSVTLDRGADLYTVEHYRIKRGSYEKVSIEKLEGCYADMLGDVIYNMVNK